MKTKRIILKVPFYKHPAGTVFDLAENTEPTDWPEDERAREKLSFGDKMAYLLPDNGRGLPVALPVNHTAVCPEHVFEEVDTRKGACRVTLVNTQDVENQVVTTAPPCGQLREENVSVQRNPALQSQVIHIDLPPFQEVAEKMVLLDNLEQRTLLEYVLRNYKASDSQLTWDVSDLNPGFYDLRICFPGGWVHNIRFIKFFPQLLDAADLPPAPKPAWQPIVDRVLEKFQAPQTPTAPVDLPNEALELCLEWGEMFEKPTQERMMQRHPELRKDQADELDRLAREVRSFVYDLCEQELAGKIAESDLHFATKRQYPWVNGANFSRMKNVGMYYARR